MGKGVVLLADNPSAVLLFKAMGFDSTLIDKQKAKLTLSKAIEKYNIIYLSSSLLDEVSDLIESTKNKPYPIITLLDFGEDMMALEMFKQDTKNILGDKFVLKEKGK